MMKTLFAVLALLVQLGVANAAGTPIGHVKTVSGEASVTSEGVKAKAEVGSPVYQGSILQTGSKSSMGVTFNDETVMSFGSNTVFSVDEYAYSPDKGKLKLSSKLTKGSLNYVSGAIAKMKPDAVTVGTPTGTIGVRGTQFLVKVSDE
jgi:hypothetical protein